VTSQVSTIPIEKDDGEIIFVEVPVWNATIANLSLMALGSSAPEIFLAILETVSTVVIGGKNVAAEIGPSTIVGSAAFNLLVISGLSIVAVTEEKGKKIEDVGVFATTAIWSIFAYVWLFLVLAVISPHEVTILEAWLTLIFFFVLLIMAYGMDRLN
jgi:solute carrier family 8 (sodium/calcium exchanger)